MNFPLLGPFTFLGFPKGGPGPPPMNRPLVCILSDIQTQSEMLFIQLPGNSRVTHLEHSSVQP